MTLAHSDASRLHTHRAVEGAVVTLLPCPFCGGRPRRVRQTGRKGTAVKSRWLREYVVCTGCDASSDVRKRPGEAAAAWNRRKATTAPEAGAVGTTEGREPQSPTTREGADR